jgi:hypothetical protein
LNKTEYRRDSRISRAGIAAAKALLRSATTKTTKRSHKEITMNRIITALALSGMFVAAPAFAKTVQHKSSTVASAGDKAAAGETKTTETKTETASGDAAKPAKKTKKSKKVEKTTEGAASEKPAEAPAK